MSRSSMAVTVEAFRRAAEYADGPATIMAVGTANPPETVEQHSFADFYFRITNSDHKHQLKEKFRRICQKSSIKKRHLVVSEEIVMKNPSMCSFTEPSFDVRQVIVIEEIPKLAKEAAEKAIKEWGRPTSAITHLVFSSTSGLDVPGCDLRLSQLLGLRPSVQRLMLYNVGCHAGGTLLRVAKDIAEINMGSRVLVVSSEITLLFFRGPYEEHFENLVGQGIFGDGAAALIVGADPLESTERPFFEIASASQMTLPDSEEAVGGHLREIGLTFYLKNQLPALISGNIEKPLAAAFEPLGVSDWNSLFWIVHPGGRAILDQAEAKLGLEPGKLAASRHILSEYGNMMGSSVLFILDEMRQRSAAGGHATTGEGLEWGVLLGFGPGVSIETVVLHSLKL